MKPNFALNLTHEAIGLLHRTARGWLTIGEAALDAPDLGEALGYLRASALGLSPQGITTKLIIPNSQILYTEVEVPPGDEADRMAAVRAALDGRTPYAVADLVFDVSGTGPRVQVAVVARETLDEAEAFAVQHRMNPVSSVAIPPAGAFAGEPFFGPTAAAARFLLGGETVTRDSAPVTVITREPARDEAATRAAATASDKAAPDAPAAGSPTDQRARRRAEARAAGQAGRPAKPTVPDVASDKAGEAAAMVASTDATGASAPGDLTGAMDGVTAMVLADGPDPVQAPVPATASSSVPASVSPPMTAQTVPGAETVAEEPTAPVAQTVPKAQTPSGDAAPGASAAPTAGSDPAPIGVGARAADRAPAPPTMGMPAPDTPTPPSTARDVPASVAASAAPAEVAPTPAVPASIAPSAAPASAPVAPASTPVAPGSVVAAQAPAPLDAPPAFASRRRDEAASPAATAPVTPATAKPDPAPVAAASAAPTETAPETAAHPAAAELKVTGRPAFPHDLPAAAARGGKALSVTANALPDAKSPPARRDVPPLTVVPSVGAPSVPARPVGGAVTVLEDAIAMRTAQARPSIAPAPAIPAPAGPSVAKPAARARVTTLTPVPPAPGARPGAKGAAAAKPDAARPRGKPRYLGLALTGILLLFLVIVAAWSSVVVSRNTGADPAEDPALAAIDAPVPDLPAVPAPLALSAEPDPVPEAAPAEASLSLRRPLPPIPGPWPMPPGADAAARPGPVAETGPVTADPEVLPDPGAVDPETADPELLADLAAMGEPLPDDDAASVVADPAALPEVLPENPSAEAPSIVPPAPDLAAVAPEPEPAPAAAPEIATGPAPAADATSANVALPGLPIRQDEIFLSATDAPPPAFDAVALPPPSGLAEAPPAAPQLPPPAGTVYQFDADGRLLATATGVVAPGGYWLIAARPPVTPPPRPAAPEVAPEATTDAATTAQGTAAATADAVLPGATVPAATPAPPADPAFLASRPRSRPAGLAPAAAPGTAADGDDAALSPAIDLRVAALRPRARADSPALRAAGARAASEAASLVLASAAVPSGTAPTMALSRRPAPRPSDLRGSVAAAVAAATQAPLPQADPEPQGQAAEPEADAEPEIVASVAPRIPTRASVAKQATFANAINLSKINLIGIYGTPSDRYAMVRTSAGRFTRVKVGDRVDGGTVAAITSSELRYRKGGQMVTLAMPRG